MEAAAKILAQVVPAAVTETVLYTVPTSQNVLIQELCVCNRSGSPASFRVSISVGGGATATKDYLYYDTPLPGNDTFATDIGVTLYQTDVIRVYTVQGTLSFTLIGART